MDFFTNLKNKISDTTKDVTQKTKDVMEISKLKSQISSEEKRIDETYATIGKKFYEENQGTVNEAYVELFTSINDSKAKIAELTAEITSIKGTYNCPSCGAEVAANAAFCAGCGAKLEPPVTEKVADVVEDVVEEVKEAVEEVKDAVDNE